MLAMFIKQFMTHFGVGVAFCLIAVVYYMLFQKRRVFFCFGGEALSLGVWRRWIIWYFIGLLFEVASSLLMHEKYLEIALSPLQAIAFTLGLFLTDRFGRIFVEPDYIEVVRDKALPPQTSLELPARVVREDDENDNQEQRIAVVVEAPRSRSWFRKKMDVWKSGSKKDRGDEDTSDETKTDTSQQLDSLLKDH